MTNKQEKYFLTDAEIQELTFGIASEISFSFAQLKRVEGVLKAIRAIYEGNGYMPTLDGEMWEPIDGSTYIAPDGISITARGNTITIAGRVMAHEIEVPAELRLCKRTDRTQISAKKAKSKAKGEQP